MNNALQTLLSNPEFYGTLLAIIYGLYQVYSPKKLPKTKFQKVSTEVMDLVRIINASQNKRQFEYDNSTDTANGGENDTANDGHLSTQSDGG